MHRLAQNGGEWNGPVQQHPLAYIYWMATLHEGQPLYTRMAHTWVAVIENIVGEKGLYVGVEESERLRDTRDMVQDATVIHVCYEMYWMVEA